MVKTYKNPNDIPKTTKSGDGKVYYFYRTVSDNADEEYMRSLEKKVSAMGWSLWIPIKLIRTEMWAIYTDKKQSW
jgi:fibronectin type 3 domain-containing protein